jgi:hypothetical protein
MFNARKAALADLIKELDDSEAKGMQPPAPEPDEGSPEEEASETPDVEAKELSPEDADALKALLAKLGAQ